MQSLANFHVFEGYGPVDVIAFAAVIFNILGYSMRRMIPLRIIAITTNCLFIVYSILAGVNATLILHSILLPLNAYRLREMLRLVKDIKGAARGNLSLDWLKPFTQTRRFRENEIVFRKGDVATYMCFVVRGRFRLSELGIELSSGAIVGELGLLSPGNRRTQTLECVSGGEMLVITYDEIRQLQAQNTAFGFYFLEVVSSRMFQNMGRLERENEELRAQLALVQQGAAGI
jgi:CRP/FNR family transcriptional regulator, cyclic AMP receptor protein